MPREEFETAVSSARVVLDYAHYKPLDLGMHLLILLSWP
jgi:hypothetical protein